MAKNSPAKPAEDNVGYPCDDYIIHQKRLELPNALMGGTEEMKAKGETFLPKEPEESQQAYEVRLSRTYLLNAFRRTVLYLSGQIFSKPVVIQDDNPVEIKDLAENIDLENNNLAVFAKKVFEAGLVDGITFVLIDYPPSEAGLTKEEEKARDLRPYWVHIPSSNLIGWKTDKYNGKTRLTQIRIKESVTKNKGKYGTEKVARIRVINLGSYEVYEDITEGNEKDWKLVESNTTTFTEEIPLAIYRPGDKITFMTSIPCLEDLAALNLAHYQSQSDQANILHYARIPILFGKMLAEDPTKIAIGPNRMIHSMKEDSDLRFVEHSGAAIGAGRESLDDLENRMALYGLQLLMPKTGRVTATEKALNSGENDCTLKTYGLIFQDFLEQCIVYTCQWLKSDKPAGSVIVNLQFRLLQSADADVLIKAKVANILPRHAVLQEFLYRGIINEDSDLDQIEDWLAEEEANAVSSALQGTFLKNMQSVQPLPQPGGTLPKDNVPLPKTGRAKMPAFTNKGK
jgi:hypothetical protein